MIRPQTCPICRTELPPEIGSDSKWFPFCSERCKQVDLYRWTEGHYAIVEPLTEDQFLDAANGLLDENGEPREDAGDTR